MEENIKLIESLLDRATEYGKTSFEIAKLRTVDKTSDVLSSLVPNALYIVFLVWFMFFLNLGLAFLLGEILANVFFGFILVAAFYAVIALFVRFVIYKWIKKLVRNYTIKLMLK